ncbi:MAG: Rhomboid family protein [Solirubrobacterales bacterium]|jgi:membrane associated rhomboid family serine protease|nr:Rhomboid family protein [Solirubrobacterales bacterium]
MATCYRHPDRETGVSCSSCDRAICPDCMTPTPVGMRCPECSRQTTKTRTAQTLRGAGAAAAQATKALIAINVVMYLLEIATGGGGLTGGVSGPLIEHLSLIGRLPDGGTFAAPHFVGVAEGDYWRLITSGFLHESFIHIGFNMYLLWILGQMLEPVIGTVRFLAVYFTALLGGSFGALLLEPHAVTLGASGAVFGLMGFAFFELRSRGIDPFRAGIGWLIVLNLALGLVLNGVSIGGHIGGLVAGSLCALAFQQAQKMRQPSLAFVACGVISVVSIVAAIVVAGSAGLGSPHL